MIVHTVFFWLEKREEANIAALTEGLSALTACALIKSSFIGRPATTVSRDVMDQSFDVSFVLHFDSVEEQDQYQVHPMHMEFIAQCEYLWKAVKVYDSIGTFRQ